MKQFIPPKTTVKEVQIPASKSYAQRAILAAALCKDKTQLIHPGHSDDVNHITEIAQQLGASVTKTEKQLTIKGFEQPVKTRLNVGESGLGIRLITSICAVLEGNFTLNGKGSLLKRPMQPFHDFLPQLGVNIQSNNAFLPIKLNGNAKGGKIEVDGSMSSQYLSGLLMALPLLKEDSEITVHHLKSIPYIKITLDVLTHFGIVIKHNSDYSHFQIEGNQNYKSPGIYTVEGDYSGASNWMVYGAINSGITINGLLPQSVQGDKAMLEALTAANVQFEWVENSLEVYKSEIMPFTFDATHCPDLFPALVVLAAAATGTSKILGVERLLHKESNRALVLQKVFGQLGLTIDLHENEMRIAGKGTLTTAEINAHNDHRIAMAGGIAASLTSKGIYVDEAESVNKSYPSFWDALR